MFYYYLDNTPDFSLYSTATINLHVAGYLRRVYVHVAKLFLDLVRTFQYLGDTDM